jgi:hypothetical protein
MAESGSKLHYNRACMCKNTLQCRVLGQQLEGAPMAPLADRLIDAETPFVCITEVRAMHSCRTSNGHRFSWTGSIDVR